MSCVNKQLVIGELPLPVEMVDTILSFCFYDAALRDQRYRENREKLQIELRDVDVSWTPSRNESTSIALCKIPRKKIPGIYGTILWGTTKNTKRELCASCGEFKVSLAYTLRTANFFHIEKTTSNTRLLCVCENDDMDVDTDEDEW